MIKTTRAMTRTAMMTAILCILAQITIPIGPVPITMQMFAVALAGYILGARGGLFALCVYLLLGACGMPVFSGLSGGLNCLIGPTGGFLLGFPIMALLCGLSKKQSFGREFAAGLAGILVVYIIGAVQLSIVARLSLYQAVLVGIVPFFVKDVASVLAAVLLERSVFARLEA